MFIIFFVRVCVYVYRYENACGDSEMRVSGDISYGYNLFCLCAGCIHAMLYLLDTCEIHSRCLKSGNHSCYLVEQCGHSRCLENGTNSRCVGERNTHSRCVESKPARVDPADGTPVVHSCGSNIKLISAKIS